MKLLLLSWLIFFACAEEVFFLKVKAVVTHGMKMIIQGESLEDAFERGGKETLLNSVDGVLSAHIKQAYRAEEMNGLVYKVFHAVEVVNPKLLEIPCGALEQTELVNTFCWLDEYTFNTQAETA